MVRETKGRPSKPRWKCPPPVKKTRTLQEKLQSRPIRIPNKLTGLPLDCRWHYFVWLTYNQTSKRCYTKIRTTTTGKSLATFHTLKSFVEALEPDFRFLTSEFVNEKRKHWTHYCRVNVLKQTIPKMRKIPDQTAITPPSVFEFLRNKEWGWGLELGDFDPCPATHHCEHQNGLAIDWKVSDPSSECVFVNPPFKHCGEWVDHAVRQMKAGNVHEVAMLLPSRSYPRWFHDKVLPHARRIVFAKGSIRFGKRDGTAFEKVFPWGVFIALLQQDKVVEHARIESFDFLALDKTSN